MSKLLFCPFCGNETPQAQPTDPLHNGDLSWEVCCGKCQAYVWGEDRDKAINGWNKRKTGVIKDVWVVTSGIEIFGVFDSLNMAMDYLVNEFENSKEFFVKKKTAFVHENQTVSLFDDRVSFKFELCSDYTSEETRKTKALVNSAISKLTPEELTALKIRR